MLRRLKSSDRSLAERLRSIGDHQIHVDADSFAEALALGTRPERIVEAEELRLRFFVANAAVRALVPRAEVSPCVVVEHMQYGPSITFSKRCLDRIRQSREQRWIVSV